MFLLKPFEDSYTSVVVVSLYIIMYQIKFSLYNSFMTSVRIVSSPFLVESLIHKIDCISHREVIVLILAFTLLSNFLQALENSPRQEQPVDSDHYSSDYYENFADDLSDSDSWCEDEVTMFCFGTYVLRNA